MAATVTLTSTTFTATVEISDQQVKLASSTGITPGMCLYADRELMKVISQGVTSTLWLVQRGIEGTSTRRHATNTTVYIGRADQFYDTDPQGLPREVILVSPHINILTGVAWVAQGDDTGLGNAARIWAPITVTMATGSLGARSTTTTTPS